MTDCDLVKVVAKAAAARSLEGRLSESRKHFSGSCNDVSKLEEQVRDLTLDLSTLRAQYQRLEHSVSVKCGMCKKSNVKKEAGFV